LGGFEEEITNKKQIGVLRFFTLDIHTKFEVNPSVDFGAG